MEIIKNPTEADFWKDDSIPHNTPMRDFYRGKVVFITGGTGFLGKYTRRIIISDFFYFIY